MPRVAGSAAGSQGFGCHYDTHDVFVLQQSGTKRWSIYPPRLSLPFRGEPFDPEAPLDRGEPCLEVTLEPGDALYLARGFLHHAQSANTDALHVTVGLLQTTWADALIEAAARVAASRPELRRALPAGYARPEFDRQPAAERLRHALTQIASEADPLRVLEDLGDEFAAQRRPLLPDQASQVGRSAQLSLASRAGARPHLSYRLKRDGELAEVRARGVVISMPAHAGPALDYALSHSDYRVGDIPGDLDAEGKLTLVRRLVREGLVRIHD